MSQKDVTSSQPRAAPPVDDIVSSYCLVQQIGIGDRRIGRLVDSYRIAAKLLNDRTIQLHPDLSDDVGLLQDTIVDALETVTCMSFEDVSLKLDVWRLDNEDVDSSSATRGERLAIQALSDLKTLIDADKRS